MSPPPSSTLDWEGQTVLDRTGQPVGKIEEIFLVEETGRPEWGLVKVGDDHATLVPLTRAITLEKGISVPYDRTAIAEAPAVEPGAEPDQSKVDALYRHFEIDGGGAPAGGVAGGTNGSGNGAMSASQTPPPPSDRPPAPSYTAPAPSYSPPAQQAPPPPPPPTQTVLGAAQSSFNDLRDEPLPDLFKQAKSQAQDLVGTEVKLAKAEMGEKVKEVGIGAGMFGGAGYVGYLATLALMLTVIFALAEFMPGWVAALIVTVVLGATAAVLAMKAKKRMQEAGPPIPEQTIESVKQTMQTVKEEAKWGLGQTR
jgi:sporulation protein YlmC with PRC-barrel domain